jgi:ribosome maturation factor RimP
MIMETDELAVRVRDIIEPVINSMDIALDSLALGKAHGSYMLRVFIDKEEGINIDDCEKVSREIEAILDVEDPIPQSYVLEVSSPGLDRPLKGAGDFKKYSGRTARVVTNDPIDKQTFFVGKILRADDSDVVLLLPKDKEVSIPVENISKARLEVEGWK